MLACAIASGGFNASTGAMSSAILLVELGRGDVLDQRKERTGMKYLVLCAVAALSVACASDDARAHSKAEWDDAIKVAKFHQDLAMCSTTEYRAVNATAASFGV